VSETMVDWTSFATGFLLGVVAWSFVFAAASLRGGALRRAVRGEGGILRRTSEVRDEPDGDGDGTVSMTATFDPGSVVPGRRLSGEPDEYARRRAADAHRAVESLDERVRDLELRAGYPDLKSVQARAQKLVTLLAIKSDEGGEPGAAANELHELMVYAASRGWTAKVDESAEEE